jgi:cytochrome c
MKTHRDFRGVGMVALAVVLAQLACSFAPPSLPSLSGVAGSAMPLLTSVGGSAVPLLTSMAGSAVPLLTEVVGTAVPLLLTAAAQTGTPPPPGTPAPAGTGTRFGTPEQAQAMLKQAIEHYNKVGRTKALADFTAEVPPFVYLDLYVACIDSSLKQSANGGFPNLVGSSTQPLSRAAWDGATTTSVHTVNYAWIDPETHQTLPKTFYYEKVGSDVCGVGAYHP